MAQNIKTSLAPFFEGYRQFREQYFRENKSMIEALMAKGQKPKAMMIACSDSRIDPSLKFGVNPGDMFIVRNVANLVPPYGPDDAYHGTSAAVEFAVRDLQVEHIIVMGHAKCGGIHALMQHERRQDDFISSWMKIAEPARNFAMAKSQDPAVAQRMCEQEAVKTSLANLMSFPWVAERVRAGKLELHGWYFDLETATLYVCDATGAFKAAT
ncbi:MAG: carbonic anhydrase [Rhodospirillaceae bacterium]